MLPSTYIEIPIEQKSPPLLTLQTEHQRSETETLPQLMTKNDSLTAEWHWCSATLLLYRKPGSNQVSRVCYCKDPCCRQLVLISADGFCNKLKKCPSNLSECDCSRSELNCDRCFLQVTHVVTLQLKLVIQRFMLNLWAKNAINEEKIQYNNQDGCDVAQFRDQQVWNHRPLM